MKGPCEDVYSSTTSDILFPEGNDDVGRGKGGSCMNELGVLMELIWQILNEVREVMEGGEVPHHKVWYSLSRVEGQGGMEGALHSTVVTAAGSEMSIR